MDITTTDSEISVTRVRAQATDRGSIGPGGNVNFRLAYGISVYGNVQTKDLHFHSPDLEGCNYDLEPVEAGDETREWRVTVQQVTANNYCAGGIRGTVLESRRMLNLWAWLPVPTIGPPLREDGGANIETRATWGRSSLVRINIPPGHGPRPFDFLTLTDVCRYRVIPD